MTAVKVAKLLFTVVLLIYCMSAVLIAGNDEPKTCSRLANTYGLHDVNICYKNNHWYLHKCWTNWDFASQQMLRSHFPVDKERRNYVREVKNALFSVVYPTALRKSPKLAAVSEEVLSRELDLDPGVSNTSRFLKMVSGSEAVLSVEPLAHR